MELTVNPGLPLAWPETGFGREGGEGTRGGGRTGVEGPGNILADPSDHDGADSHALCSQQHPPLPIVPQGASRGYILPYQLGQVRLGYRQQPCTRNSRRPSSSVTSGRATSSSPAHAIQTLPCQLTHVRQSNRQQPCTRKPNSALPAQSCQAGLHAAAPLHAPHSNAIA